ncbi:MAG: zinc ribbon domain-containing protein [Treponema sp.]|jgi:putative FmdB family regulatory protein|nr:zinc ribbon domain-containing protein [Treponema sp.]
MPTYEYKCRSCGSSFEITQSMKDDPLEVCPTCGKEIRRVINGGGGVIFKGSGFYVTDKSKKSAGGSDPSSKTPAKPAETGCTGCAAAQSGACAGNSAASSAQAANS